MGSTFGLLATAGALGVAVGSPLGGLLTATLSLARGVLRQRAGRHRRHDRRLAGAAGAGGAAAARSRGERAPGGVRAPPRLPRRRPQLRGPRAPWSCSSTRARAAAGCTPRPSCSSWSRRRRPCCSCGTRRGPRTPSSPRPCCATAASSSPPRPAWPGLVLMGGNSLLMPFYLELAEGPRHGARRGAAADVLARLHGRLAVRRAAGRPLRATRASPPRRWRSARGLRGPGADSRGSRRRRGRRLHARPGRHLRAVHVGELQAGHAGAARGPAERRPRPAGHARPRSACCWGRACSSPSRRARPVPTARR